MHKWGGGIEMTEEEKQAALDALDTLQAIAYLNLHGSVETTQFQCIDTIRAALSAQKVVGGVCFSIKK